MDVFTGKPLREVQLGNVSQLVDSQVPESLHLEYKRELKLDARDDKKEFLRDVTAFANAEGGLLIYGVEEARDDDGKPTGVPCSAPGFVVSNMDAFVMTVEHLLRDGLDERLPGYNIRPIEVPDGKFIFLLRVEASLRAPHMVVIGKERRFFARTNGGKQDMSTAQVRDSVLRTQSIEERVREFVDGRRARLRKSIGGNPFWALHVVPLVLRADALDVTAAETIEQLRPVVAPFVGCTAHCLEGYRAWVPGKPAQKSHAVVFRTGPIEFFDQGLFEFSSDGVHFPCIILHQRAADLAELVLTLYREGVLTPPLAIALTLENVQQYRLPIIYTHDAQTWPVPQSIAPEPVVVTDVSQHANAALRPILDVVWNAFGQMRCPAYDQNGDYRGYPRPGS